MDATAPSTDEVARMYDESAQLSHMFIEGQEHLPYWYDERDDTPVVAAAQRITVKVGEAAALRPGDRVLDVGCGVGGPATVLAERFGVSVTGVTISEAQVVQARRRARLTGTSARVDFQHGDYMSLAFPDDSFDAVVAIESLLHAPDLAKALGELRRVLRPGGWLAFSESTRAHGLTDELATQIATMFRISQLHTMQEWADHVRAAGFELAEYTECGPRVYGMGLRYLDRVDELAEELTAQFGEGMVEQIKETHRAFLGWGSSLGYVIMAARKPKA